MALLKGPGGSPTDGCGESAYYPQKRRNEQRTRISQESALFRTPVPIEEVHTYQLLLRSAAQTLLPRSAIVTVNLKKTAEREQAIRTLAALETIPSLLPRLTSSSIDKQLPGVKRGKFYPIPGINNKRAGILVLGHSSYGRTPCGTIGILKVRNETGDTFPFFLLHLTGPEKLIPESFMLLARITGLDTPGQSPSVEGKFIPLAFHEQKPGVALLDYIIMGGVAVAVDANESWIRLRNQANRLFENAQEYLQYRIDSQPKQR